MNTLQIAGIQMDITIGDIAGNLARMRSQIARQAAAGAGLVIFPECSATGYCFSSREECLAVAEPVGSGITESMTSYCRDAGVHAVFGMVERDGDRLFNVVVLTGPQGVRSVYRKVHLPYLGLDMQTTPGDRPFEVVDVDGVKIGLNICYDSAFPESSRCLALLGADLIVLPTNWPPGAECLARTTIATRAMENAVYYAAINRVGDERGFHFIGRSSICSPDGSELAVAESTGEQVLTATIDTDRSRRKHFIRVPGTHEIDRMADRRPEMYGLLTQQHNLPTPRDRHRPK
ncbi:MAG: carbon-nitrogen hydrolase family protein [Planctomycetaceae bacterium]